MADNLLSISWITMNISNITIVKRCRARNKKERRIASENHIKDVSTIEG
jgi:hypothetical protein